MSASPALAFLVASLGIAVFSGMDAVMKGLVLGIGVYAALLWRNAAGIVISGALFVVSRPTWPRARAMRLHLARGVVGAAMSLLFFWGLARVPMAQAIALTFIAPLIALFLAAAVLKERVGRATIAASIIAFAGVLAILAGQARGEMGPDAFRGALAIVASAICYAFNIILMRRQAQLAGPIEIAFSQNLIVTVLLGLAAPILAPAPPDGTWPAILLAAALATASLLLLSWAYARAEASYLAPSEYTAFVWAALFGFIVFGERVSPWTLAGAALIIGGCLIAARHRPAPVANVEAAI